MANLGTLYRVELKKILKRKIVWVSMILMLVIILITVSASLFGSYYVDGVQADTHYHMFQVDKGYQQSLDKRFIDQELLEEMEEGYGKIPIGEERYSITEEYQTYARPYSAIFNFVRDATGMTVAEGMRWVADEQDLYVKRARMLEESWQNELLTQGEIDFWKNKEENLEWPIRFRYKEGYWQLIDSVYTIGLMTLLVIAVCLSGVFPEEHIRKTDQLILSCKYGRKTAYLAKLLAGISFSFTSAILFSIVSFATAFLLYGADGFSAAIQLINPKYSWSLSVGEATLIAYGVVVVAAVFMGIFVMMLSELTHSGIGTLSLVTGIIILPMFVNIPDQYRVLGQL